MFFLKRNLPTWERATRIIAGAAVGAAVASGLTVGMVTWLALATAATLVLTAFVGFCPACAMVGRRYLDK
jgi:phosphate/sulfate permease